MEIYKRSEILDDWFWDIFRLKFVEEILLELEDVSTDRVYMGNTRAWFLENVLQDTHFPISSGFPKP